MELQTRGAVKPLLPAMRVILLVAGLLVLIAGVQLFILTEQTAHYFAWTIKSPLTAAFMGAGYWSSFALVIGGALQRYWVQARISVPSPLAFSILMLIATLLHLDQMHIGSNQESFAVFAAWAWIGVYVAIPILLIILLLVQARTPGVDPPRVAPMAGWVRLALTVQAVIMLALGAALFIAPQQMASIWPWQLTPLTAQVVGGWLVGLAVAAGQSAMENDWRRTAVAAPSYIVFGLLQLVAVLRYPSLIDWSGVSAGVYVIFLVSVLVVGGYSLVAARRASQLITPLGRCSGVGR